MEVTEPPTFSAAEATLLSDGEANPYGTDGLAISWAHKDHHVVLSESGRLVAHAGFLLIEVEADGVRIPGVGLGSVMVQPSRREQGIGSRLVQETTARMGAIGRPFALLFCRDIRLPFYEQMGWGRVAPEVTVDQEQGPMIMPLLTCWFSFDQDCHPPRDQLRLLGPPF
jgi:GNAT superfamily N-acetyltransferase